MESPFVASTCSSCSSSASTCAVARNIVISLQYRTKRAGSLSEAAVYGGPGNARSKKRRLDPRQDPAVVESVSAARFDTAIEVRVKVLYK